MTPAGYFAAQGVPPRSVLSEFRVTADAVLPVGTALDVRHFVPGQFVDVRGTSQGKGFQGAMKRHGFKGQSASHGNSVSHRVLGSTGQRQDPGKVIKGKKMPGHMGEVRVAFCCVVHVVLCGQRRGVWWAAPVFVTRARCVACEVASWGVRGGTPRLSLAL